VSPGNGRLRVAVLSGGRSSEHDISVLSGAAVIGALDPDRYDVVPVRIDRDGGWQLEAPPREPRERLAVTPGEPRESLIPRAGGSLTQARAIGPIDVVLPVLHGPFGEDGTVQGMLEMLGVPYVGSGVLGSALTMDKDLVKHVLRDVGINVAAGVVFRADTVARVEPERRLARGGIGLPCFVKPARLGSSVGITKVVSHDQLQPALELAFRHDSKVLVEEMLTGFEVEVGVLGNDDPIASLPGRINIDADWYDFDAKYSPEGMRLEVPAVVEPEIAEELQRVALLAFRTCECAGMARIDFFVTDGGRVVLNEINTIPGFTATSVYARLFEASGIPYGELLDRLIDLAIERHARAGQYRY
jgi:D-alanine-D-alanine ligase